MIMRLIISLLAWLQNSFWMRLLGMRPARRNAFLESRFFDVEPSKEPTVWFHASSLGELEMLTPVIEDFYRQGCKVGVTAFSDSALPGLKRLRNIAVYADLSPRETEWKRLFDRFQIKKLILAKYDFWPGLLEAASRSRVPVYVVNAQMRRSLTKILRLFRWAGSPFPKLNLFANDSVSVGELKRNLPSNVSVTLAVDPRWERVGRRRDGSTGVNPKLETWAERIVMLPLPVGLVGSAWKEDLAVVLPAAKAANTSLVVVPHDLSEENIEALQQQIAASGMQDRTLLVNEMGVLVELYRFANWAFVGGGFGKGIHSLLEPASYSIPVACGPNRYYDFKETKELGEVGILTRCESAADVTRWIREQDAEKARAANLITQKRAAYRELFQELMKG